MNTQEAINQGLQHHRAGQLQQAEAIYRQVLAQEPQQPDALHLLGMIAHQVGQFDLALQLINRAIAVAPRHAEFHGSAGLVLSDLGRVDEAILAYRRAIAFKPDLAAAYNNLGNLLAAKAVANGKSPANDEAISYLRQAMTINPNYPDPAYNLANIFRDTGRLDDAAALYQRALKLRPNWPQAYNNLGVVEKRRGEFATAAACFDRAVALAPNYVAALNNLGDALCTIGQFDRAVAACRLALQSKPDFVEAHNNLGNALCCQGRFEEGIAAYQQALTLRPDSHQTYNNMGNAYQGQGDLDRAMEMYKKSLELQPDFPSAHWNVGLVLLTRGEYAQGWPEFEWRWRVDNIRLLGRGFKQPIWDGGELNGKRILLHAEQGLGDTLFFLRYIPQVVARGGKVVVACQPDLVPLVRAIPGVEETSTMDRPPQACDVRYSLMGLPGIFKTTMADIPSAPYVKPDPAAVAQWHARVPGDGRLKVGLVWANKPDPRDRCPPPADWAALAEVKGIWWCSLQKGLQTSAGPGVELTDWTAELGDLAATAALIANLDLVVTVDTAVAHLAGAMGKPTWLVLRRVADWRWLMDRTDSPWYPSMRLFRQEQSGDWKPLIAQVAAELGARAGQS